MKINEIKEEIKKEVSLARQGKSSFKEIFNGDTVNHENEFIFFIKPEVTLESKTIDFSKILDLVFDKLGEFNLEVSNIKVLGADYLKNYNIISQHYGVINKLATNPLEFMSEGAKENLLKYAEVDSLDDINVLGGVQFLEKYKMFNADSTDVLLQNIQTKKLAGGTYVGKIKVDTDTVYLINGFHPRQLTHFTEAGRSIVVMTVSGNLSWADARGKFIGATNPEAAESGSLRRTLFERRDEFGMPEVNQGLNGFHLSAGPVEGLVELMRYNSDFSDPSKVKKYSDFSFGKKLSEAFSEEQINVMLNNKNVSHNGKNVSVFDLTEEKSSNESFDLLKDTVKS